MLLVINSETGAKFPRLFIRLFYDTVSTAEVYIIWSEIRW
jgi:hypothetical protein